MSHKTYCEMCGKKEAGGGMRFCTRCLGAILCTPATDNGGSNHRGAVANLNRKAKPKPWKDDSKWTIHYHEEGSNYQ